MKVTVLLPVFNGDPHLKIAIESILIQDFADFEFIIIDDASSDRSPKVIRKYAKKDKRIRAIYHSSNQGLASTLNEGLHIARSTYVARIDQDDEALPHRLKTQYLFMQTRPEIVVAGSYAFHMSNKNRRVRLIKVPTISSEIEKTLKSQNCFYHPSVMFRRKEIVKIGGYRSKFKNAEDYDLWLRISKKYKMANIPMPLIRYRINITGMTFNRRWEQLYYFFLAQVEHEDEDNIYVNYEQAAKIKLEEINKTDFLINVTKVTAEELIRLDFLNDTIKLIRHSSKEIGWKNLFGIIWDLIQGQKMIRLFDDEDWIFSEMNERLR